MYQDHSSTQVLGLSSMIIGSQVISPSTRASSSSPHGPAGYLVEVTWLKKRWREFGNDGNTHESGGVICPQIIREWQGFVVENPRRQGASASPSLPRAAIAEMAREAMQKRQEGTPTRTLKANHVTNVVISILHYTSKKKPGDQNWKKLQWFIGVSLITI